MLERVVAWRGCPAKLRMDNGPELVSVALAKWAEKRGVELEFIQPSKPIANYGFSQSAFEFKVSCLEEGKIVLEITICKARVFTLSGFTY